MGLNEAPSKDMIYAIVIADGSIRVKVEEGTPKSIKREFENSKGEKVIKWELVYSNIDGIVTGINFKDGDYGQVMNVEFNCSGKLVQLSLGVDASFAQDLMKKLPNVDFNIPVKLAPYSLTKENGKVLKGITVYQDGEKIQSFFYDAENNTNINGFPTVEDSTGYTKDDWKIFFINVKKFLVKYTQDNVLSKVNSSYVNEAPMDDERVIQVEEDISVEEIDFNAPPVKEASAVEPAAEGRPMTEEEKDKVVKELIFGSYGISDWEAVKIKAMEVSNLAYLPSNKDAIIKILSK